MTELTFSIAGLPINPDPLPALTVELTADRGFVITFLTLHSASSQMMEQLTIGNAVTMTCGGLVATGTVAEASCKENYTRFVLVNITY